MHKKRQAKGRVIDFLVAQGIFFSGVSLAAVSETTATTGLALIIVGSALVLRDLYISVSHAYYLENQTPEQNALLKQLKMKSHIVVAHIKQDNEVKSFVVACKDPSRFDVFVKLGLVCHWSKYSNLTPKRALFLPAAQQNNNTNTSCSFAGGFKLTG